VTRYRLSALTLLGLEELGGLKKKRHQQQQ